MQSRLFKVLAQLPEVNLQLTEPTHDEEAENYDGCCENSEALAGLILSAASLASQPTKVGFKPYQARTGLTLVTKEH
ncbi:hypothetical protein Q5P01_007568 [Channa striata]|uniref:Uncharacterized protein n=1 Tax=Channa striata TaxID=64152 RepID=A0AA88SYR5_CHASR|nr:hypothetical protein Q5P01_007568 [Channa striata]